MHKVCTVISCLFLVIMFIISYEVIARYVFNSPTSWGWVINEQLFLVTTLIGGTYAALTGGHIRIEVFYDRFPKKVRPIVKLLTLILFVSFMGTLIWKGGVMAREAISVQERATGIFHLPIYPFKAIIPIAALLFLIQGLIWILKENDDKKE